MNYPSDMVLQPLLSAEQVARRVRELGEEITAAYSGRPITLMPILHGSLIFTADLVRCLPLEMVIEVCGLRSYAGATTRPSHLTWTMRPPGDLTGRDVLVVDDIVDSGATLRCVLDAVRAQKPASLRSCVLLAREPLELAPDFLGFRVGPGFVVGYGLDYDGRYRNLPDIAVLGQPGANAQ
ncbi:MAG: Hypoxanthine-guanine phosphoribosyltransferase [Phycisphaerae bacterium]|nr:Hypoxanthine-guanine phosphoribosyltransferase [Phycisphaerae bacterium]